MFGWSRKTWGARPTFTIQKRLPEVKKSYRETIPVVPTCFQPIPSMPDHLHTLKTSRPDWTLWGHRPRPSSTQPHSPPHSSRPTSWRRNSCREMRSCCPNQTLLCFPIYPLKWTTSRNCVLWKRRFKNRAHSDTLQPFIRLSTQRMGLHIVCGEFMVR